MRIEFDLAGVVGEMDVESVSILSKVNDLCDVIFHSSEYKDSGISLYMMPSIEAHALADRVFNSESVKLPTSYVASLYGLLFNREIEEAHYGCNLCNGV